MYSRAVHGLAVFDTDTCSGWERRRCESLCAASSTRQERPCFARSTTHARSLRSPAAAARRPTRGFARARSGPCATATPAVSRMHRATATIAARVPRRCPSCALCSSPRELVSYSRRDGEAAAGHGHAHVCPWDLHGRVVRRQAARARRNGLHQRQQVRAARGRVCGRLRCVRHGRRVPGVSRGGAHAQRAGAWRAGSMRQDTGVRGGDGRGGFSGRERGGVRRARTDGVKGGRRARLRGLGWC